MTLPVPADLAPAHPGPPSVAALRRRSWARRIVAIVVLCAVALPIGTALLASTDQRSVPRWLAERTPRNASTVSATQGSGPHRAGHKRPGDPNC